ncbi:AAA family ATPase [Nitrospira sp. Nam74]
MIRKVQRIKSFGVYSDFRWTPELPVFNRYNLLYGWNYSGKSTLSRVFRCFELKQSHPDFTGAETRLETEDGQIHESANGWSGFVVRVFNADFIRDNLSFDDGNANPILILGKEDIEKQNTLQRKKDKRDRLRMEIEEKRAEKKSIAESIELAKTSKARDIKKILSLPDYDKTRFGQQIDVVVVDVDKSVLSDSAFQRVMATSLSSDKKAELSRKSYVLTSTSALTDKAAQLLKRTVGAKAIERFKADPELEKWVNSGRSLHETSDNCHFCGSALPSGLLDKLAEHFSTDYENLMRDLVSLIQEIELAASETLSLDDEARFYPELSNKYGFLKGRLEELLQQRKKALMTLAGALHDKQTKAFAVSTCPNTADLSEELRNLVSSVNVEIDAHNRRTREFEQLKKDSIAQLEKHHAAQFIFEQDYKGKLLAISDLEKTIAEKVEELNTLNAEILTLEQEVSKAATGAERINLYV